MNTVASQFFLSLFFLIAFMSVDANMASPYLEGTEISSAWSSRNIDILNETIDLTIDKNFETAKFIVEYTIRTDSGGVQIPLLFYATHYIDSFKVWLNDTVVVIKELPYSITKLKNYPGFDPFSSPLDSNPSINTGYYSAGIRLSDLKYFEAALAKGIHRIRVEYFATKWEVRENWVYDLSFRYSLSPAKYWSSFGTLKIRMDLSTVNLPLTTNLGQPDSGTINSIAVWTFKKLPAEFFEIKFTPEIPRLAKILIRIDPFNLMLITGAILILLHIMAVRKYRKRNSARRFSWIVIAGSITLPFLIILTHLMWYKIITTIIGENAHSGTSGYELIYLMILYPIAMPVYWLLVWAYDSVLKARLQKKI